MRAEFLMGSKLSPAASMFEKVLRAFETRGITYSDVLARLRRLLSTGASPSELLPVLRRRESTERLPEYARIEALLLEAIEREAARDVPQEPEPEAIADPAAAGTRTAASSAASTQEPDAPDGEVAVDLDFNASGAGAAPRRGMRAAELDLSSLAKHLRAVEERAPPRGTAALEALTRSYERAREGESAAAERATALASALEAARAALEAEQGSVRQIQQERAESLASAQAAREQALQAEERLRNEVGELRDSLSERQVAIDQARQALEERDARIAALARERSVLETALQARARAAAQLEAELRAARAGAESVASQPRTAESAAPAPTAPPAEREVSRDTPASPPVRRPVVAIRTLGWIAAAALLAGFTWLFTHRATPQAPRAAAAAPAPKPGSVIRDCPGCPEMTVLPTGRFTQGSAEGAAFEQPLHWVVIRHSIALSTNPITVEEFAPFAAATGRDLQGCDTYDGEWKNRPENDWERPGFAQTGTHPVTCVSWNDAQAYAKWLTAKTGHRYRLPSASEWEFAARAGLPASRPWGAEGRDACASADVADASAERRYPGWTVFPCDDGYVYTAPVGAFKSNPFGLNDMLGNVLQWTEDCWHGSYLDAPVDGSAWLGGDCSVHEVRGASWFSPPAYARADYRDRFPADYRTSTVGIRLVREIGP